MTAAIALKTRSPVLASTAFIPLVGPAYLAYTLRTDHKPENTIDRLALDSEKATLQPDLPTFKHGLLNYDWAPELHVGKLDRKMFNMSKEKFSGMYELIWNADELQKVRKKEAKVKRRKAREAENEKARDESRGRKTERRDQRNKIKYDKQKPGGEEQNGADRPGGRKQPERGKRIERRKR